jgi:hypothetical protein
MLLLKYGRKPSRLIAIGGGFLLAGLLGFNALRQPEWRAAPPFIQGLIAGGSGALIGLSAVFNLRALWLIRKQRQDGA